jgi:uncharacterized protein YecE (DUF72 family)
VVFIGTSGWQYAHWRSRFYPAAVPQKEWLEFYCRHFATVELNNSFYRLPSAAVFRSWRRRTPEGFVVAVKASRFLTHVKKLADPAEPVRRFLERALELGGRLGPVLLQLPPRFHAAPERLEAALAEFDRAAGLRVAVELRDESWFSDEVRAILERHRAALVLADTPRRKQPQWRTADWGFVRFHEGIASPRPCYSEPALRRWSARLAEIYGPAEDVYVYFNNDPRGCAIRDAGVFARLVEEAGLQPSRVTATASVD